MLKLEKPRYDTNFVVESSEVISNEDTLQSLKGKLFKNIESGEVYILMSFDGNPGGPDGAKDYRLIGITSGNRWNDEQVTIKMLQNYCWKPVKKVIVSLSRINYENSENKIEDFYEKA